jgi:hypothetical protein
MVNPSKDFDATGGRVGPSLGMWELGESLGLLPHVVEYLGSEGLLKPVALGRLNFVASMSPCHHDIGCPSAALPLVARLRSGSRPRNAARSS